MKHNRPGGEPSYCGTCGLPGKDCGCGSYSEFGSSGATNAGSAHADDALPGKGIGAGKEGGEKKPFGGAKPFGKE